MTTGLAAQAQLNWISHSGSQGMQSRILLASTLVWSSGSSSKLKWLVAELSSLLLLETVGSSFLLAPSWASVSAEGFLQVLQALFTTSFTMRELTSSCQQENLFRKDKSLRVRKSKKVSSDRKGHWKYWMQKEVWQFPNPSFQLRLPSP